MRNLLTILVASVACLSTPLLLAAEIAKSVGNEGVNQPDDVLVVQLLLNQIPDAEGGPVDLLVPDGLNGPKTVAAIGKFQKRQLGEAAVTGRVDPAMATLEKLNAVVDAQSLNSRIVRVAKGERLFWKDGARTELELAVSTRLQKYWKAVGLDYTVDQLRDAEFQENNPWSAAFVSWVMKTAGAGDKFRYAASHWQYVAAAKMNRTEGNDNPLKAYRTDEKCAALADIVVKRRGTSMATYENIEMGHITHGDIVVATGKGEAETIGGNVSNSVKTTKVTLGENSKVNQDGYFAIVKVK